MHGQRNLRGEGQGQRKDGPNFRVAHEPIRKTDCKPVSSERAVRMFLRNGVHVRRRARLNGIALQTFLGSDTPTIMYTIHHKTPSECARQKDYVGKAFT